jgi:hypothetical protein
MATEVYQGRQVSAAVTIIWNASGFESAPPEELTSSDKVVVLKGAPDVRQQEPEREAARRKIGRKAPLQSGQPVRKVGRNRSQRRSRKERRAASLISRSDPKILNRNPAGPERRADKAMKPFFESAKPAGNKPGLAFRHWTKGDSAMWDFINVLYREYCLARLVEMRQLELKN